MTLINIIDEKRTEESYQKIESCLNLIETHPKILEIWDEPDYYWQAAKEVYYKLKLQGYYDR